MIHNFFLEGFRSCNSLDSWYKNKFYTFCRKKNLLFERLINENNFVQIWLININDKNFNRNKNQEHVST